MIRKFIIAALAAALPLLGCGGGDDDGGGGAAACSVATCGTFAACGGDPTGSWKLGKVCGTFSQAIDKDPACADSTLSFDFSGVAMTLEAKADMSYPIKATGDASGTVSITEPCAGVLAAGMAFDQFCSLAGSQMPGSPTCSIQGTTCDCPLTLSAADLGESGTYTVSGTQLVTTVTGGSATSRDFCVSDCELQLREVGMDAHMVFTK